MKNIEKNKNINRGYRKLEVWQEAVELFKFIKTKVNSLDSLSYKTKAQVEDSVFSVSSNIAEGYCRRSIKENIRFNDIALGSLGENYSQIFTLYNAGIIDENWFHQYDQSHYSIENKLIAFNKSQLRILKNNTEWKDDYLIREFTAIYNIDDK